MASCRRRPMATKNLRTRFLFDMSEGAFEAKLTAKRETAAGIYLTIQVQPNDYGADLATLRVGSHLMLAWSEIVNTSVEPIEVDSAVLGNEAERALEDVPTPASSGAAHKERKPFHTLPLSQQAAIRCQDNDFKLFLGASNADEAARLVRQSCRVDSRAKIIEGDKSGDCWLDLEARYQSWLTDNRYAELRRG